MPFDRARFGRILVLISFVSAVFLLTAAELFERRIFLIAAVAIGTVALVTAIIGALIALATFEGGSQMGSE